MEPQIQYVRSADGATIAFYEMGEGVPIIFSSNIWDHLTVRWQGETREASLQLVRDGFRIVRYDMRGMGMSGGDVVDFSVECQMEDLDAVRERLQLERFALFSNVHAAPACISYAARCPERVTHLVMSMPFANGAAWYEAVPTLRGLESFRALGDEQWELYTITHAAALSAARGEAANAHVMASLMRQATTPTALRRYFEALRSQDVTPLLSDIRCPTLVITLGGLYSEIARSLVAAIKGARLIQTEPVFEAPSIEAAAHVTRFVLGREPSSSDVVPPAGAIPALAASSGTAIVLFADLVDSTALTERLGDAAFRDQQRALDARLRAAIADCGGSAVGGRTLGDGVLAWFASARDAITAGCRLADVSSAAGMPLHIGLHAGDILHEDDAGGGANVWGGAVNIAARISGLTSPGEILVSGTVRDLARTSAGVTFEDRGEQALKGIGEPVRVFAVHAVDAL